MRRLTRGYELLPHRWTDVRKIAGYTNADIEQMINEATRKMADGQVTATKPIGLRSKTSRRRGPSARAEQTFTTTSVRSAWLARRDRKAIPGTVRGDAQTLKIVKRVNSVRSVRIGSKECQNCRMLRLVIYTIRALAYTADRSQ